MPTICFLSRWCGRSPFIDLLMNYDNRLLDGQFVPLNAILIFWMKRRLQEIERTPVVVIIRL